VYSNRTYYIDYYNKIVELATRFHGSAARFATDFNDRMVTVVPGPEVKIITQFGLATDRKQFILLLRYVKRLFFKYVYGYGAGIQGSRIGKVV
jgi:hypothetical protein